MTARRERLIHLFFEVGVVGKGIDGVLELAGGLLLIVLSQSQIHGIVRTLTQHELSEDPTDLVARALVRASQSFSPSVQTFGAVYLLVHGVVKVGLVAALLYRRLWAFPTAIGVFLVFLAYQLNRYAHTHAPWLIAVSIADVIVIVLTWLEYARLRGPAAG